MEGEGLDSNNMQMLHRPQIVVLDGETANVAGRGESNYNLHHAQS